MSEGSRVEQRPRRPLDDGRASPVEGSTASAGVERVQPPGARRPTVEQVADRVYELLVQDLRLENERLGRERR